MLHLSLRASGAIRAALLALPLAAAGCSGPNALDASGIEVAMPSGWGPYAPPRSAVPGEVLSARKGPSSTVVVYRTLPVPGGTPSGLARELASRLENLPGFKILSSGTARVGGVEMARVEVIAPGDGDSLAPSGLGRPALAGGSAIPTHRLSLGIPRGADTIWIVWHYAEASPKRPEVEREIEAMIRSISIRDRPGKTSS